MPSLVYSLCPVVLVAFVLFSKLRCQVINDSDLFKICVLNVFVLTICNLTNRQNETNNSKISYFLYIFYDKKNPRRIKQKFIRVVYLYSKCTDCRINLFIHLFIYLFRKLPITTGPTSTWIVEGINF
jgi:hypothetical protein